MTTPVSDHVKHRQLYYNGIRFTTSSTPESGLIMASGFEIVDASPTGIRIRKITGRHAIIPWYQVIQFVFSPEDELGAKIERLKPILGS